MARFNLDLKNQAYNLKIQERKINFAPVGNKGDLASNISETINQISNQSNFMKTHNDVCTKENIDLLKNFVQEIATQATSHQVPENVKKRVKDTQSSLQHLKAA